MDRKLLLRTRYNILRHAGYSSKVANKLKFRKIKGEEKLFFKSGKLKVTKKKELIKTISGRDLLGIENEINEWKERSKKVTNNSLLSDWGHLTQHKPHDDNTAKAVKTLMNKHNFTNKQSYYFLYLMYDNNLTYQEVFKIHLVDEKFEIYRKEDLANLRKDNKNEKGK